MLGATPVRGLVLATGHFRNGILLAPITAEAIAELVATGRSAIDLAPFSVSRFGRRCSAAPLPNPLPASRGEGTGWLGPNLARIALDARQAVNPPEPTPVTSRRRESPTSAVVTAPAPKPSAIASSARFSASAAVGGRANRPSCAASAGDQVLRRHAGQPRRARGLAREQRRRPPGTAAWPSSVGFVQRRAPGHQREVGALQLELHGARAQRRRAAAGARPAAPARGCAARSASAPARSSSNVSSAPMLFASRSGMTGRGSMRVRLLPQRAARRPQPAHQRLRIAGARCRRPSSSPIVASRRALFGPTPHSRETGSGARNAGAAARRHLELSVRLGQVGGDLGDQLRPRRCRPTRAGRARRRCAPRSRARDLRGRAEQRSRGGHVQERLVERQRLDQRRDRAQDVEHRALTSA